MKELKSSSLMFDFFSLFNVYVTQNENFSAFNKVMKRAEITNGEKMLLQPYKKY